MVVVFAVTTGFFMVLSGWLWWKLLGWVKVGRYGRIAIAFKRKVQLQAPLTEFYLWTRQLPEGENGRVIYRNGGVTVAIVKPVVPPNRLQTWVRSKRTKHVPQAASKQGTWSIKQDTPS